MKILAVLVLASNSCLLLNVGCSSSDDPGESRALGGPVSGDADAHCEGRPVVEVDAAVCHADTPAEGEGGAPGEDAATGGAAGSDCNRTHDAEYGETLPNSEGDDDDCKYRVSWTSTAIRLNQNVTFTVTATDLALGQPLEPLAGEPQLPLSRVEVYQPCEPTRLGPVQNANADFKETAPGVFEAGPLRFDQPGRWVVRFHFYEQCNDGEGSPHGHVAFFVDIP
ncbi:MAG TPA: hypothetical protein VGJ91_03275 [Polyangiaceae bacterium]|jgi:hypothetical protein